METSTVITLAVFLVIYILSVLYCRHWTKKAHSKGGIFYGSDTDLRDIRNTFIPFINTIYSLLYLLESATKDRKNFNKFFNVKK